MFLIKIFHFLKGYVILSVWGENKDRFLDRAVKCGIKPIKALCIEDRLILTVSVADFLRIRSLKVPAGIHILKKCGMVFWIKRLKKRKIFMLGAVLFFSFMLISSQFIWDIKYKGVENCDKSQLDKAVRLAGLYEGMPKSRLPGGYEMKNIILNNTDGIAWAWVYIKGTQAVVEVREDIIPPTVYPEDTPCDIVAARSGIIKSIVATHGRCVVQENQAVAPGDTIISGTYSFLNEPGYQVHAKGRVLAYTEHTETGEFRQNYCYKKYTGKRRRLLSVKLFGKELCLGRRIKFEKYDQSVTEHELKFFGYNPGIGMSVLVADEYITETEPVSYDTAVVFAQNQLEKQIARGLLPGAEFVDKEVFHEKTGEDTIRVTVTMKFIEEIGTEKQIEEVTFIEPKTDRADGGN